MNACANATELYITMHEAIQKERWERTCTDPESPQTAPTIEARPGCTFELRAPRNNVQICVPMDFRWAIANTLHFFAATEEAEMLENYNRHAKRFVIEGKWLGAYGAIAMPQVQECIARLKQYPTTRRAVVSMGAYSPQDINRPACWSFLQFLSGRNGLNMLVYQRSLHLTKVMPYDLVVLSNLHMRVATEVGQPAGSLIWTVGSLHAVELPAPVYAGQRNMSIQVTADAATCLAALRDPQQYEGVWTCIHSK